MKNTPGNTNVAVRKESGKKGEKQQDGGKVLYSFSLSAAAN